MQYIILKICAGISNRDKEAPMPRPLTQRQQEVLDFIRRTLNQKGYPPSIREIGAHFRIRSTNGVRSILLALERKGEIRRKPLLSRSIELTNPVGSALELPPSLLRVPIIGRVAAGQPILAEQNVEGVVVVDKDLLKGENTFALRVRGESMVGAGIFDGDLVFARQQSDFRQGDIVVAVIGDEATVKYYYPDNGNIRLEPANHYFQPIIIERDTPEFYIAGKVVGVFRRV
ncbi:MAG: transcriptional repressor LexA [bacterium]